MTGEHPLDKKLREQGMRTQQAEASRQLEQRRAEDQRAHTATEWPKDKANLHVAIEGWNKKLVQHGLTQAFSYHGEPQTHGDIARGHVQVHDTGTASARFLDIRVPPDGRVLTTFRQGRIESYAVGNGNVALWNELLNHLHDQLPK